MNTVEIDDARIRRGTPEGHARRREALRKSLPSSGTPGAPMGLAKSTSNLFRDRIQATRSRLDLSEFNHVLDVDTRHGWIDVEGLASYESVVDASLPHGVMPAVVPQLKTITVAGAVAGVGIEASSHRFGLVHDTVSEIDVLLPDGEVVHCTPDNAHSDLFFGFPNSYGTLGYALRLKLQSAPVKPFVRLEYHRHERPEAFFAAMAALCGGPADFVDGVVFEADSQVLCTASFCDEAPWLSDYRFEEIYYRSLREREFDYLLTRDFLWRWDTDWFWCSKNFGAQNPLIRRLLGRERLNSRTYTRWMRWNARWGIAQRIARLRGRATESVIQDVDIPIDKAPEFLAFLMDEIGILPIWTCPIRPADLSRPFTLYPLTPGTPYVNFGFWDVVESPRPEEPGHLNRRVERKVIELGGIKSLYSTSHFTREAFDQAYGMDRYAALKHKYDPGQRLLGLYDKCVLRA